MKQTITNAFSASIGVFLALALCGGIGYVTGEKQIITPFASTCVILFLFPHSPLARPKVVLIGYVVAALTGYGFAQLGDVFLLPLDLYWWQALAVSVAILLSVMAKSIHPPALGMAIIMLVQHKPIAFLFSPMLIGVAILLCVSTAYAKIRKHPS